MKKVVKLLTVLSFLGCVVSCNGKEENPTTSINPTTTQLAEENPTKVVIVGPSFVEITKTIPLVADVVTSSYDDVTWTSSDSSIASVNEKGIVTGIKEGEVTITATSVKYPTLSATHNVSVTVPKITAISVFVEGNDNVIEDSETKFYKVPLGQVFYVNYELTPSYGRTPSSISYEVLVDGNAAAETNSYSLEIQEDNRAKVVFYDIMEGVEIVASARYDDYFEAAKKGSRVFNVYDPNTENNAKVISKIAEFKEVETSSLLSSTVVKERKSVINKGTPSIYKEEISHKSYSNASYVYKTDSDKVKTNLYHGVNKNKYYAFLYDGDQHITEIYKNEAALANSELVNESTLYFDVMSNVPIYGHNGILNNYLSSVSTISENVITFGNTTCYAYAKYELNEDQYIISSKYIDDNTDIPYDVKLTIDLDKNNVIKGYTFEETLTITYVDDKENEISETITYSEKASNFVFGKKTSDSAYESLVDLNQYYYKSFNLVDLSGKKNDVGVSYDYTNTSKYGADSIETIEGIKKYTATYDKALVFKIGDGSPSTATTLIDQITSSSSDPDSIPNVSITSAGIITINAKKDDNNIGMPGESTFTFTSSSGYSCSIMVEFKKTNLKGLNATHIDESNDFGEIFKGDYSDYFFLNTDPDEDIYTFGIEIIEGNDNGLALYHHVKDDLDDNPEFSYAIEGKIVGSYKFKFYVKEDESIKTEQYYTITVEEPYTKEYLIEKLVTPKKVYTYSSGLTLSFELEFTSETSLTFTQTFSYDEQPIQETINYQIEDGRILIPETQYFKSDFYFSKILGHKCPYSKDLSTINFYLQMTADESYEDSQGNMVDFFSKYKFTEKKEIGNLSDFLDGKTLTTSAFVNGAGMCTITIAFLNNKAEIIFTQNSNSSVFAKVTIDYSVVITETSTTINISNMVSSNAAITEIRSMDYIQTTSLSCIKVVYMFNEIRSVLSFDL